VDLTDGEKWEEDSTEARVFTIKVPAEFSVKCPVEEPSEDSSAELWADILEESKKGLSEEELKEVEDSKAIRSIMSSMKYFFKLKATICMLDEGRLRIWVPKFVIDWTISAYPTYFKDSVYSKAHKDYIENLTQTSGDDRRGASHDIEAKTEFGRKSLALRNQAIADT
jgi:hypothetical protein